MQKLRMACLLTLSLSAILLFGCGREESADVVPDRALPIPTGTYAVDKNHTYIVFSYMHQGLSYPLLRATGVDGELELDAVSLENSSVRVAIRADSIRTNMDYFDRELASRKFFNVDDFPYIMFVSDRYEPRSEWEGTLSGFVTIRGITRPLALDVRINGATELPVLDIPAIGFSATGTLKRADFDLDRFIPSVGNDVSLKIETEFWQGSNEGSAAAARLAEETTTSADPLSLQSTAGTE